MVFSKSHIISEIKRTAQANKGAPLGTTRFENETGIKKSDWMGKYWARWGDALIEAGFKPNALQGRLSENYVLQSILILTRELGHFPVKNEIKLRGKNKPGFPSHNVFERFGRKQDQIKRLAEFCKKRGDNDVLKICLTELQGMKDGNTSDHQECHSETQSDIGYVYLLKSGRYYKIGRTKELGRRKYELAIQLPQKTTEVHHIKTDDPVGIETYWHNRFKDRHKNGEWFELTINDVAAFKRRKFM